MVNSPKKVVFVTTISIIKTENLDNATAIEVAAASTTTKRTTCGSVCRNRKRQTNKQTNQ
ncbi:hypothetical protein AT2G19300 [Arabidopsis thaliana]|uniref:Uncharacterized protein At2g19300 n=2 Tax=Arabidopsis thaliana TaxID=3702 RepID=O64563_ARATH|nr:uncharacterized protein AT2G19300 [Arabidopsis thaliana]AAC16460.1 hypothetical protein [Arabidopsis thaliana]AAR99372.1 hypothetical protein At2g19300 [Arabidopsis thaliana]ABE65453.1 hypothetical protein At2g19300 [Arabidopsis thaliana]AEC06866.1 hypothetical protein AT2G19300 [Arabidopsis thaliana]|eukprot:NP_179520.1 hypothetical protein AT2G19300 [Arabidopsis thaliana]